MNSFKKRLRDAIMVFRGRALAIEAPKIDKKQELEKKKEEVSMIKPRYWGGA